jgi:hypothetical protein
LNIDGKPRQQQDRNILPENMKITGTAAKNGKASGNIRSYIVGAAATFIFLLFCRFVSLNEDLSSRIEFQYYVTEKSDVPRKFLVAAKWVSCRRSLLSSPRRPLPWIDTAIPPFLFLTATLHTASQNSVPAAASPEKEPAKKIKHFDSMPPAFTFPKKIYLVTGLESSGTNFVSMVIAKALGLEGYQDQVVGPIKRKYGPFRKDDVWVQHLSLPTVSTMYTWLQELSKSQGAAEGFLPIFPSKSLTNNRCYVFVTTESQV